MGGAAPLGELTVEAFLEQYWQKKPLLVRSALPAAEFEVPVERRLELACDPAVDSRLILTPDEEEGGGSSERGPFDRARLDGLGASGWTLLLQEADRHEPRCAALLDRFRFVPNWRIDDAMLSHAVDGGGVGAHVDRYDVFLVQTSGRRRWRIESEPREYVELRDDSPLPLVVDFEPDHEWILEPGDLLYLPPGVAHEGVSIGECTTCSIGFRVPDPRDLYSAFLTQLAPPYFDRIRYADPGLKPTDRPGELPKAARDRLRRAAQQLFEDDAFDDWLGCYVSDPLREDSVQEGELDSFAELRKRLQSGATLERSAIPHFVWFRDDDGAVRLYIGGEGYTLEPEALPFAELLCGAGRLDASSLEGHLDDPNLETIVVDAVLRGFLKLTG